MKSGIELIAEERKRQVEVEKWDYSHDEDYKNGEMIGAAGCYIASALNKHLKEIDHSNQEPRAKFEVYDFGQEATIFPPGGIYEKRRTDARPAGWIDGWPWSKEWDKRKKHDKLRSLVIAGALIAAEIDRLQAQER